MKDIKKSPKSQNILNKRWVQVALGMILTLIVILPTFYFYNKYRIDQLKLTNPGQIEASESRELVKKVNRIIELPKEDPTVATVSDVAKLQSQPFFKNAQNGDKVLIFNDAKKAYLYRPGDHRIIEVAPITINPASPSADSAGTVPKANPTPGPVRFVLLNGTGTTGLTRTFESELIKLIPGVVISDRDNTVNKNYKKSLLIDISKIHSNKISDINKVFKLETSNLPEGEKAPQDADFVVILGSDYVTQTTPAPEN